MVTGIFTCCIHVHMKVLNCGYICRVVLDTKVYISGDVYMESILVYYFHCMLNYLLWEWAAMKFSTGTLTTHCVDRLVTAIRGNVCMPPYIPLELNFS